MPQRLLLQIDQPALHPLRNFAAIAAHAEALEEFLDLIDAAANACLSVAIGVREGDVASFRVDLCAVHRLRFLTAVACQQQ